MIKQTWLLLLLLFTTAHAIVEVPEKKAVNSSLAVYFSPNDKITDQLIPLIDGARKSIYAAIYMLTDKKIADALVRAKQRGITMQLIIDPISTGSYGKSAYLATNNIPLYVYQTPSSRPWFNPIMHNKFACIDETILWTGSFNWTVSANLTNEENAVVSKDPAVCKIFRTYFDTLLKTKTAPFVPACKKDLPIMSLRETVAQILATTSTEEELFEALPLALQQNCASRGAV